VNMPGDSLEHVVIPPFPFTIATPSPAFVAVDLYASCVVVAAAAGTEQAAAKIYLDGVPWHLDPLGEAIPAGLAGQQRWLTFAASNADFLAPGIHSFELRLQSEVALEFPAGTPPFNGSTKQLIRVMWTE
jgi:hypothetical protein